MVFPKDVESPPQSVADVEHSQYKAAWHEDTKCNLDGHKIICTHQTVTPRQGEKPECAKCVADNKTQKDELKVKIKARLMADGFSQARGIAYVQISDACTNSLVSVSNNSGGGCKTNMVKSYFFISTYKLCSRETRRRYI